MLRRIPGWFIAGGVALAMVAGYVNAFGLLGVQHEALSHMTGLASTLAIGFVGGDTRQSLHLGLVLASFVVGAAISGAVTRQSTLRLGRRYSVALLAEAGLLVVAASWLRAGRGGGDLFAAAACGLQNAMASTYSGAIIRTTHMTGILTDFGIAIGHALRGDGVEWRKLVLFAALFASFLAGGALAGPVFRGYGFAGLYAAAAVVFGLAIVYSSFLAFRGVRRKRNPATGTLV